MRSAEISGFAASIGRRAIGLNTMHGELQKATIRERWRSRELLVIISLMIVAPGSTVFAVIHSKTIDTTADLERITAAKTDLRAILEAPWPSVYAVLARIGNWAHEFRGAGSAWVVDWAIGWPATNSDVAESFEKIRAKRGGPACHNPGTGEDSPDVDKSVLHPGCRAWQELLRAYQPHDSVRGTPVHLSPACDLALLQARQRDRDHLGPDLALPPPRRSSSGGRAVMPPPTSDCRSRTRSPGKETT